jgi:hypothetical protein
MRVEIQPNVMKRFTNYKYVLPLFLFSCHMLVYFWTRWWQVKRNEGSNSDPLEGHRLTSYISGFVVNSSNTLAVNWIHHETGCMVVILQDVRTNIYRQQVGFGLALNCNPTGIENIEKISTECLDATQKKHINLKRDGLIRKFSGGWTSCYFHSLFHRNIIQTFYFLTAALVVELTVRVFLLSWYVPPPHRCSCRLVNYASICSQTVCDQAVKTSSVVRTQDLINAAICLNARQISYSHPDLLWILLKNRLTDIEFSCPCFGTSRPKPVTIYDFVKYTQA